jgi:hypothetical protein
MTDRQVFVLLLVFGFLVIIHGDLGFPKEHLQGSWNLGRGRVLTVTGQMFSVKWGMWDEHWWTWIVYRVHRTLGSQGS